MRLRSSWNPQTTRIKRSNRFKRISTRTNTGSRGQKFSSTNTLSDRGSPSTTSGRLNKPLRKRKMRRKKNRPKKSCFKINQTWLRMFTISMEGPLGRPDSSKRGPGLLSKWTKLSIPRILFQSIKRACRCRRRPGCPLAARKGPSPRNLKMSTQWMTLSRRMPYKANN